VEINSPEGKKLLEKLEAAIVGTEVDLGLPALMKKWSKEKVSAILIEKKTRLWVFHLLWLGIALGDFSVERRGDQLLFEQLT